jgi:RNA polymerase-associated protein CTR9
LREALNFIEQTAKKLPAGASEKPPIEYTVLHASLLAYQHPGMSPDELARNRATARQMLTGIHQRVTTASTDQDWAELRNIPNDFDVFVQLADLWQGENLEKALGAYQTAVSVKTEETTTEESSQILEQEQKPADLAAIKTSNNLGAVFQLQGSVETAERTFQEALQKLAVEKGKDAEVLKTVLAYNLGRAYEEGGEVVKAAQWYRDVLRQHPEHMECKLHCRAQNPADTL